MDAARRVVLFRHVNEHINELLERTGWNDPAEFLCECGGECGCRVRLRGASFAAIRRRGGAVLAPGHGSLVASR